MTTLEYLSPVEALQQRAQETPEKPSHIFLEQGEVETDRLTFGDLDRQARGIAAYLQTVTNPGERALLIYPTGLDFVRAMYGCLYAGLIPIPTNPPGRNRSARRLEVISQDAQAQVALSTPLFLDAFAQRQENFPELEALRWINHADIEIDPQAPWQRPDQSPNQFAFIQYTSGSTNMPKGVIISNQNLYYNSRMIFAIRGREYADDSLLLTWTPLFHDMGLILGVFQGVYDRHASVLMNPIAFIQKPVRWLRAISTYRATFSGGPNFAYAVCVDKIRPEDCEGLDLSEWRIAYNGAEPVRAETHSSFAQKFSPFGFKPKSFQPAYGLAETTLLVSSYGGVEETVTFPAIRADLEKGKITPGDPLDEKNVQALVSCGPPKLDLSIEIVNPHTCERCAPDEVGEIWLQGENVAEGYWNRPEETEISFRARINERDEGPFLRTGDLGFMYEGDLYVTGRHKDMIIIRGRNYYPQDIENTVQQSHPGLRPGSTAAFSFKADGFEQLIIVQEVRKEYVKHKDWDEGIKKIRFDVAREYGIRAHGIVLIFPSTIPKTSSGKIMRAECREMYLNNKLVPAAEWRAPGS